MKNANFELKVRNTIKKFKLFKKTDKIIVACSGGKDSTTALYILHKLKYNVEALFIDLGIPNSSELNLKNIKKICNKYDIKLNIVKLSDELGVNLIGLHKKISKSRKMTSCAICGVVKRYYLNKKSRELKATKLVTGHNLDDEVENVLLNVFGGNLSISLGLGPKSSISNDKLFVQRVKPLYYCLNSETKTYSKNMKFDVIYCNCPLSTFAFRRHVRRIIESLEKNNKKIKLNIVNNFLKQLPKLRKKYVKSVNILKCKSCGEPSRNKICMMCELSNLKE